MHHQNKQTTLKNILYIYCKQPHNIASILGGKLSVFFGSSCLLLASGSAFVLCLSEVHPWIASSNAALSPPPVPTSWIPNWIYDHRYRWAYPYRHAELALNQSHRMKATFSAMRRACEKVNNNDIIITIKVDENQEGRSQSPSIPFYILSWRVWDAEIRFSCKMTKYLSFRMEAKRKIIEMLNNNNNNNYVP